MENIKVRWNLYLANEMSDANRTQIKELLESLMGFMAGEIAGGQRYIDR